MNLARFPAGAIAAICLTIVAIAPASADPTPPEFQVNTFTTGDQLSPKVTPLVDGGFVVVWTSDFQDGFGRGVYAQRYWNNGGRRGGEFLVNTRVQGDQQADGVAGLADGSFVVTWNGIAADNSLNVYGQRFGANGQKIGEEFKINKTTTIGHSFAKPAALPGGGFVVCWTLNGLDGSFEGIYAQRYNANGVAVGADEFRVNTTTDNVQNENRIVALEGGGFVIVWTSNLQDGSGVGVFGQRFDEKGRRVGKEFAVNRFKAGDQRANAVVALSGGGFMVAMTSTGQDGSGKGVYGQRFDAEGRKTGKMFRINRKKENDQQLASLAAFPNDGVIAVWQSSEQDGSEDGIYGQVVTSAGVRLGPEFRVNRTTLFDQTVPVVAILSNGNYVVVWQSQVVDGSGHAIVGRIFRPD